MNAKRETSSDREAGPGAEAPDLPETEDAAASVAAPGENPETTKAPSPVTEAVAEMRDRWLRAEAEMQNVRRRAAKEREEQRRELEDTWLLELAALDDDVARARNIAREAGAPDSWTRGVELVSQRIRELLARHGVTPIEAQGKPFDPALHEALAEPPRRRAPRRGRFCRS